MLLNVHDKIVLVQPMGAFKNIGEICEIIDIVDNCISFKFGDGMHLGCMSMNEFEKYFKKYESKKTSVTKEDIESLINESTVDCRTLFDKCTVVTIKLKNGFVITESSACVDPANYNERMGFDICMKAIRNKLWELEGYRLQCELSNPKT